MDNKIVSRKVVSAFVPAVCAILAIGETHTRSISREKMLSHEGLSDVGGADLRDFPGTLQDLLNGACESGELCYEGKAGKGSGYRIPGRPVESASGSNEESLTDEQQEAVRNLLAKADFSKKTVALKDLLRPLTRDMATAQEEDNFFRTVRSSLEDGVFPGYTKEGNTKVVRVAVPAPAIAA